MATAEELLAATSVDEEPILVIDNQLRTINIPKSITNLGVEHDDDVLKLTFQLPRYISDTDLSTFSIRVNYLNSAGDSDIYYVSNVRVLEHYMTFTWLVGPTATAYKGDTKFNVCLRKTGADSVIEQEYNTTVASLPVLEGLEADEGVVSNYSDILEQWRNELFGIGDTEEASMRAVSQEEQSKITALGADVFASLDESYREAQTGIANKGAEVLATIPEDYQTTYQTTYQMAEEGVRTKADAIVKSTQGATIVVNDSSDDHIRNLRVFGKTTQTTTTGKNLLNVTLQSQTINEGIVMVNPDKTIELRGKFTSNTALAIGKFAHSGECIFSAGIDSVSMNNSYLYIAYPDDNNIGWYGEDKTFTNDGSERTVFLVIVAGSYKNVTLKPMIRFSSIEDSSYEPYSGGFASPSPNWSQDIVSIGDTAPTIASVRGKNFVFSNETTTVTMNNGITISSVQGSSEYILGGTQNGSGNASANLTKSNILLTPGTFTLSVSGLHGNDYINLQRRNYDIGKTEYITTGITNKTSRTFTVDELSYVCIELVVYGTSSYDNDTVAIQLEAGNAMTEYEGYKPGQATLIIAHESVDRILNGIRVGSDGNYTDDDGQQWICDEVDFERGLYIQRIGVVTLETAGNVQYSLSGKTGRGQLVVTPALDKKRSRDVTMCNLAVVNGMALEAVDGQYYVNPVNMVLVGDIDETEEDMLEKYATMEMLYVLETPVETPLTAEDIEAYKALHTNYPNTTVMNDAGAWMELTYNADTKTYIDNGIKDTVAAVMEEIENGSY